MPVTKEHIKSIVDEALALRDYIELYHSKMCNIGKLYLDGQDPAICMEMLLGIVKNSQRPPVEIVFAESQRLKRNWRRNDWHKRHQQMRRDVAKFGGDPNDVQMFPHPVSGSKFTHITSPEEIQAATERAQVRSQWIADRIAKASAHMNELNQIKRTEPKPRLEVVPLTPEEVERIIQPDGPDALPE